jgi:hypothetical protein
MLTKMFEDMPASNRLEMLVDMLRYENASQAALISKLEDETALLRKDLKRGGDDISKLQQLLDLQNARTFREMSS